LPCPVLRLGKLIEKASENFDQFSKVARNRTIARLGTRFINRIDIPTDDLAVTPLSDWFTVGIAIPSGIAAKMSDHSFTVQFLETSTQAKVLLSGGSVPPALLNHFSFLLDIDAYLDENIPARMDAIWEKAALLRKAKNTVFEGSITDRSRKLFR
jgi:uncharacterized protein (TIGR04255 family)